MTNKVLLIGCVKTSKIAFDALKSASECELIGVVCKSKSPQNSDFCDLALGAHADNIACLELEENDNEKILEFLIEQKPDLVFCIGWSHLLPNEMFEALPDTKFIGYHPAPLPYGRGRHPLIWALILGLEETASCLFLLEETADTGAILSQAPIAIADGETASSLYAKACVTLKQQLTEVAADFETHLKQAKAQDANNNSSWRKRSARDGKIDWRMNADAISRLVKALAKPYPGATGEFQETVFTIHEVEILASTPDAFAEPGKVLDVQGREILVKCWKSALWIKSHNLTEMPAIGDYFLP